jgi:hypothetical protein
MYEAEDEMVDKAEVEMAKEKMKEMADMKSYDNDDNSIAEIDLDEILAELDAELNEAKEAEDEEEIEAEEDVEDVEADEEESDEEEKEVSELSMDELEAMIRDIVSQEMGPDGEEDMDVDASVDMDAELPDTADDEVNLDEILAELLDEETTLTEGKKRSKYGGNKGDIPASKRGKIKKDTAEEEGDEDYKKKKKKEDLSEIMTGMEKTILDIFGDNAAFLGPLVSILAAAGIAKGPEIANALAKAKDKVKAALAKKSDDSSKLDEAMETVEILRNELNEVNLLNAKLLYVNKIFKAKNLTEAQKIKVVQAFDKAESAKEAKLVYESLNETFTAKAGKSQIKESLGFASKAAGVAPQKQAIVESNEFISRMQKLANIK